MLARGMRLCKCVPSFSRLCLSLSLMLKMRPAIIFNSPSLHARKHTYNMHTQFTTCWTQLPFLIELWVGEDLIGDASAIDRWVGVEWADDDLELGLHRTGLLRSAGEKG